MVEQTQTITTYCAFHCLANGVQSSRPGDLFGDRGFARADRFIAFIQRFRCQRPHRHAHHQRELREHAGITPIGLGEELSYR